jgi:hypothetical protein
MVGAIHWPRSPGSPSPTLGMMLVIWNGIGR